MRRVLKWVGGGLAALVVLVVLAVVFLLGPMIKTGVTQAGPRLLGVPVGLQRAQVSVLKGQLRLEGLAIGNPKGFDTSNLVTVSRIAVDWAPASVLTRRIHVRDVTVEAPQITYEQTLGGNNISALLKALQGPAPAEAAPEPESKEQAPPAGASSGPKVVIDSVRVSGGQVRLSLPGMGSAALPIPLPPVHLTDIGKEKDGASIAEVLTEVFQAILKSVTQAASGAGQLLGQGLGAAGRGLGQAAGGAGDAAGKAVEGVGDAAGKVVGGAGDAAGQAVKGIKGLLGGSR